MGKCLTPRVETRDNYGYPALATFIEFGDGSDKIHIIRGSADAGDAPGSLYANAPNGSTYIPLTATALNYKLYIKMGLKGLTNGAWVASAALT